jgi:hypothetical protein
MTGMDTITILISVGSMLAAIASAVFAGKQAIGSKEARAKAEESHKATLAMSAAAERSAEAAKKQAQQAEELLAQMSDIASSLRRHEFELTHKLGKATFSLHNVTMGPIKVLDVVNADEFVELDLKKIVKEFQPNEMVQVDLYHYGGDANLRLRIDGREDILCIPIEYNLELLKQFYNG